MIKRFLALLLVFGLCASPAYARTIRTIVHDYDSSAEANVRNNALDVNVSGGVAEDAASTERPVPIGGIAESTVPTEVADGDAIGAWFNTFGKLLIAAYDGATDTLRTTPVAQAPVTNGTILMESVTFDASPDDDDPQTSPAVFIGDKRSVGFLFQAIIDRTAETVQVDYTFEVSPDNSLWISADVIMDANGTDGPVATVNQQSGTDATIENVAYLAPGFTAQYIRIISTCTDTDADDTAVVLVYLNYQN